MIHPECSRRITYQSPRASRLVLFLCKRQGGSRKRPSSHASSANLRFLPGQLGLGKGGNIVTTEGLLVLSRALYAVSVCWNRTIVSSVSVFVHVVFQLFLFLCICCFPHSDSSPPPVIMFARAICRVLRCRDNVNCNANQYAKAVL